MKDLKDSYEYFAKIFSSSACPLSEVHGMMIGYLVADKDPCFQTWSTLIIDDLAFDVLPDKAQDELKQLFLYSHVQLASDTMPTYFLLPADNSCFLSRLKALSDFSRGFLYGFGLSEYSHCLIEDKVIGEMLNEITQFSQIDVHTEDDSEDNTKAYEHVVSYINEHLHQWKALCLKVTSKFNKELLVN